MLVRRWLRRPFRQLEPPALCPGTLAREPDRHNLHFPRMPAACQQRPAPRPPCGAARPGGEDEFGCLASSVLYEQLPWRFLLLKAAVTAHSAAHTTPHAPAKCCSLLPFRQVIQRNSGAVPFGNSLTHLLTQSSASQRSTHESSE